MAFRTWGRLLLTALGVSVLAGAGQLGIAYGFGVVRLDGAFVDDSVNRWPAQLAWVGWFAAVATVAGAVLTDRLTRRGASPAGTTEVLSIAGLSGLGAIVVAPLSMQPARAAELGGTVDPVWAVGICAILGAVVGAGTAIAVLLKPPFGWNIVLTATAVWLLALVSVAPSVASSGTLPTVRLGVLEPSWLDPAAAQRLAMLLLPTLALLAGAAVGALARRAGHLPLVGGAAGAAGPVLLAFAYLTAGPGTAADRYQLAPYYGALIAVAAGALGSTATTVLPRPVTTADRPDAIEPTDILQPLPPSPEVHDAADRAPADPVTTRAAGAPSPAHWDWPAAGGVTPAPVPAGLTRRSIDRPAAAQPADRDEPTPAYGSGPRDVPPVVEAAPTVAGAMTGPVPDARDADRPAAQPGSVGGEATARHLAAEPEVRPAPAEMTPGVAHELASDNHEPASAPDQGPDVARRDRSADDTSLGQLPGSPPPGRRTSAIDVLAAGRPTPPAEPATRPAPTAEPAHPTAAHAEATRTPGRTGAPSVSPNPAADLPDGAAPVSAAEREVAAASTTESGTEATPTRTTRSKRSRATTPAPRSADDAAPTTPSVDDATVAGTPAAEAAGASAPAGTGRAKRTRKPRTSRTTPDRAATEPTTTTSDSTAGPTATTPDTTAGPATTTPDRTSDRTASKRDRASEPAESTPGGTSEKAGTTTDRISERNGTTADRTSQRADTTADRTFAPADTTPDRISERAGTTPAAPETAAAGTASTSADPAREAGSTDAPQAPAGAVPGGGSRPGAGERRNFFFDPEPAPAELPSPPTSPRPRIPMFEDATPGNVRPAWPVAPAANWPVAPRGTEPAAPGAPAAGRDGTPDGTATPGAPGGTGTAGTTRPDPAPRPRHRALPDLGRSTGWDALANARPADPPATGRTPESNGSTDRTPGAISSTGRAPETTAPIGRLQESTGGTDRAREATRPILWDGPAAEVAGSEPGRHADRSGADPTPEATGGKSKARRGLFRRNRGKGGEPGEVDRESEPLAAKDEEYVDWVAGLASDDDADDARSLRTGRHHRD
ncbi:hypothetical protein [Micromonospora sp. NPDC004551]|uniref:hypothetical protein n=1 Tax=Micromonospora sp. NPDC004551 TaxID=3154284 RepID=UPI0033AD8B05